MGKEIKREMNLIRYYLFLLLFLAVSFPYFADGIKKDDHESRELKEYIELSGGNNRTKYQINVKVSPKKRELDGVEIIRWTNRTGTEVNTLRINLFYNAFKSPDSTFFTETSIYKASKEKLKKYKFGSIDIQKIKIINRNENITGKMVHLCPDDGNLKDRTNAEFKLTKPVVPGQTIWIKTKFRLKMPEIFYKTGQSGNYLFFAHWYPKVCVLEKKGEWISHQFHRRQGLYSEFNDFHVRITIPKSYKIGATGIKTAEEKPNNKLTVYEFKQENVQDFAWAVYPDFIEVKDKIRLNSNEFDTEIILLLSHFNRSAKERYLNIIKFTLKYFDENLASYPYRTLTVIDTPLHSFNSSGHVYSTLLTGVYLKILPVSMKYLELMVVHGIAHQFWLEVAGSDTLKEPWLSEGIAVFYEMEIMDKYFEKKGSLLDLLYFRIFDWEIRRRSFIVRSPLDRANNLSWSLSNNKILTGNIHSKISLLLRSLKNIIGEEEFKDFFRYYFNKVKFKHHDTETFKSEFNNYFKENYSWAFDQFVGTDMNLDTAVYSVKSDKVKISGKYNNEVVFVRKSGFFPVELSIVLEGGKEIKFFWKKNEKWKKVRFTDESPIEFAMVDPNFKIPLDINLVNNSRAIKKENGVLRKLAVKFGFYFQNILASLIL